MPAAMTRNMAVVHLRGSRSHGWLRQSAWMATTVAALMFLSLNGGQKACAQTVTFTVIHHFTGTDGVGPMGVLVMDTSGNLYGTTNEGGAAGFGTVFKIDPSGDETVLHDFTGGTDGRGTLAGVVRDASGNLYGTTWGGGSSGYGTVFKIDFSGNFGVLHSFNGADGAWPAGLVQDALGNLYGTTEYGGSGNYGTIFKISPSGIAMVIHHFTGGSDGASPSGLVMDSSGSLYATSSGGGSAGRGTVFKIDAAGNESVLYSFSGADGVPTGALVLDTSGNLYGATVDGGAEGFGTVFKIDASGNESVLHSFHETGGVDGSAPNGGLVLDDSGNLYGTTSMGGTGLWGRGTVFRIDSSGNETVLHNFIGESDGVCPQAGLMWDAAGNLYGPATAGGSAGYGTVFKISFPVPFSSFDAKLNIAAGSRRGFDLQAFFTPGADLHAPILQGTGSGPIDPVAQGMTLAVGTYTVTIPPSSFHQTKKGWWVYEGKINGVSLDVRISQRGVNPYELQFETSGVDLTSLPNPVTVTLTLGNNNGTTEVNQ